MSHLVVLCEGETEQLFVAQTLGEYLWKCGVYSIKPELFGKKVDKDKADARGGVIKWEPVYRHIMASLRENSGATSFVTMMTDLYAFPSDFPDYEDYVRISNPYERVEALETAIKHQVNSPRFVPYIQLHEYEALLLADLNELGKWLDPAAIVNLTKSIGELKPEEVNSGRLTAPSKRIIQAATRYKDDKPLIGSSVARAIGIPALKEKCPHFGAWIEKLCRLSSTGERSEIT